MTTLIQANFTVQLPTWEQFVHVLLLQDYNTRVVVLGTMVLGLAAGVIGVFLLLRKRSLLTDAVSHATLPGIAVAYMLMVAAGGSGKSLPILLLGAFVSGVAGMCAVLLIHHFTRLKEEAALGIVLSVFFGLGVALLGIVQKMATGSAAGLESFIYGKTASMLSSDARLITIVAAVVVALCVLLYKEFKLLCFDAGFATARGFPTTLLDVVMMTLVVVVTVIGLQAVGLILIIAMLIIPPAAARFWSDNLVWTLVLAAIIGSLSGMVGAAASALLPRLPAGAIIVVISGIFFLASMLFGIRRGVLVRLWRHVRMSAQVERQHLLRAMYECCESSFATQSEQGRIDPTTCTVSQEQLLPIRSWTARQLGGILSRARRDNLVVSAGDDTWQLTTKGYTQARNSVRNHRLWELYLINHADVATGQVDRTADRLEHILGHDMVQKLEDLLKDEHPHLTVPDSPHAVAHGQS